MQKRLSEVTAGELEAAHLSFILEDLDIIDPATSVEQTRTPGGGSYVSVLDQLGEIRSVLDEG